MISVTDKSTFLNAISDSIYEAEEGEDQGVFVVMVIDLRHFYRLDLSLGYTESNLLIGEVCGRLEACAKDGWKVFRIGDYKFGLVISQLQSVHLVPVLANSIIEIVRKPYEVINRTVKVDPRMGLCLCLRQGMTAEELAVGAEKSLLKAKSDNQSFHIFEEADDKAAAEEWAIEDALTEAVEMMEFSLLFQPQIDLHTFRPNGCEALIRWNSKEMGPMAPEKFIPVAEKNGYIGDITAWVIQAASREISRLRGQGDDFNVAINVSTEDIYDTDLLYSIDSSLEIWGLSPKNVTIEVTEGVLMKEPDLCIKHLNFLRDKGIKISIDDFGTGYSSLQYFKRIPADELKIDQSFVFHMVKNQSDAKLVELIIDLAHKFGLSVVAEGVEDKPTLEKLVQLGCDRVQGYYFAKPKTIGDLKNWFADYSIARYF